MRILALDTSTEWCSVAVGDGASWHARDEHAGQSHSERLLPMVAGALADAGWALTDLDGIAFGAGPGSFTGLRIGCGVAQGLAFGGDVPVVPVPTLVALAQEALHAHAWRHVVACLDARMREVYVASYARDGEEWAEATSPAVLSPTDVPDALASREGVWFGAGNGFRAYATLGSALRLAATDAGIRPAARAIAELALPRLARGEAVAAADALPLYVRHRVALTTAEQRAGATL